MAVERIIDLENSRYADREYEGRLPASSAPGEQARRVRREKTLGRLRARARGGGSWLTSRDLADLLTVLELDE
jgi:hypothetical protein